MLHNFCVLLHSEKMDLVSNPNLILQGVFWLLKDRIFCKWKERFFILTESYLMCFKKKPSIVMDIGELVFKVFNYV